MYSSIIQSLEEKRKEGIFPVIPDIKVYSPKEGPLLRDRSIKDLVEAFERAKAPCLSVVTESKSFKGSFKLLQEIVDLTKLPVLRKDFICNEDDIKVTAQAGARSILLIASMHSKHDIYMFFKKAIELGLEPLIEIHSVEDIDKVKDLKPAFTGINNKDILILEKDDGTVETTEILINKINWPAFILSESGIDDPVDLVRAKKAGADGALVGTAILREKDAYLAYSNFNINI